MLLVKNSCLAVKFVIILQFQRHHVKAVLPEMHLALNGLRCPSAWLYAYGKYLNSFLPSFPEMQKLQDSFILGISSPNVEVKRYRFGSFIMICMAASSHQSDIFD